MNPRKLLSVSMLLLFIIGLSAAGLPFVLSLRPTETQRVLGDMVINLSDLKEGIPTIRLAADGRRLFLLRPTEEQLNTLTVMEPDVWNSTYDSYAEEAGVLLYFAHSTGKWGGCFLEHYPPRVSLLSPRHPGTEWLGGYWDPGCEVSYDYAGRAIKTWAVSYNGYTPKVANLPVPQWHMLKGNRILVSTSR